MKKDIDFLANFAKFIDENWIDEYGDFRMTEVGNNEHKYKLAAEDYLQKNKMVKEEIITDKDFGVYCTWIEDGIEKRDTISSKVGVSKLDAYVIAEKARTDWNKNAPDGQKTYDVCFITNVIPLSKLIEYDKTITENE